MRKQPKRIGLAIVGAGAGPAVTALIGGETQRLAKGGVEVVLSESPAAWAKFVAADTQRWAKVAKDSGATVD